MTNRTPIPSATTGLPIISSIIVAIPARNEQEMISTALACVDEACGFLPSEFTVDVVVACDRCTDRTASLARTFSGRRCTVHVVESDAWRTVGEVRRAAISRALKTTHRRRPLSSVWIANTDADTSVGTRWLVDQLAYANNGIDAVAGVIDLRDDADMSDLTVKVFGEMYTVESHGYGDGHSHVHGANLGVRASAYETAGGFPHLARSEDRALWQSLLEGGHRCVASCDVSVLTSGRFTGRVDEGFAYWLGQRHAAAHDLLTTCP